ncbi:nibrin isoform X2 [Carettochelys insculpta]|uniref:nibrin isoform X2 n=1 Tax=Carettochelys insculpta TaxID=44489 RepID=UPI003EC06CE8
MWKLVPAAGPAPARGEPYRLLVGTEYVVGRKNCAVLIQDDQSISRSHAVLTVQHPETNLSQVLTVPELVIKDTSKYGTFVNGEKLLNGTSRSLKSGGRVNFGVFESKFRVEYERLIVCSSCLETSGKTALNQVILQLGGLVVNDWSEECTHLVMKSVKVTVKTICALICNRPIIKPEYFEECIGAIRSKQQLPKLESFYPPVDEPSIGTEKLDLSERHERKMIFEGKTFLFLSAKQHKKLSSAIILGGGEAKLLTEREKETSLLVAPGVCVVDVGLTNSQVPVSDSVRNWIDSITTVLQSKNLRAIPEAEIGLAVIFMSMERYCNPQNQPGTAKDLVTLGSAIPHPTLSQSLSIDETIMPVAKSDSSVYVADTEPEELMDTCMDIGEEGRTRTPKMDQRDKMYSQNITTVKETPNTSGAVNTRTVLSKMHRTPGVDQKSQPLSPSTILGVNRERASQQQSNSMKNYFQAAPKKRERIEEGETSIPKLAKMEEESFNLSNQIQPTASLMWKSKAEQTQKEQCTLDLKTKPVDTSLKLAVDSSKSEKDETVTKNVSSEKPLLKKRKVLDDLVEDAATLECVFGSKELDWEADTGDHVEEHGANMPKRRCLETKEKRIEEVVNRVSQENEIGAVRASEKKTEVKQESSVLSTDRLQDDANNLPSRLLLTEFRSLVVSHPRPNSLVAAQTNYGQLNNFKKFKKVPYPGAGQLPHIIGGSDLIAHHAKKNSQLEEWLRQEMEEQNRHAREELLADDLFRYDPHVKRRR